MAPQQKTPSNIESKSQWLDREYRTAYAQAHIEQGIAYSIRVNREKRGMSQKELANKIGTSQSTIARLEDCEYGAHSLETLKKLAEAFDCALSVKFIPFSTLADETKNFDFYAKPFKQESHLINRDHDEQR